MTLPPFLVHVGLLSKHRPVGHLFGIDPDGPDGPGRSRRHIIVAITVIAPWLTLWIWIWKWMPTAAFGLAFVFF